MSILKKTLDFLFGKDPDIFDNQGRVVHKLPKKNWEDWHNRIVQSSDYNWREHVGFNNNDKPKSQKNNQ